MYFNKIFLELTLLRFDKIFPYNSVEPRIVTFMFLYNFLLLHE